MTEKEIIGRMSLPEKIALCEGDGLWRTLAMPRYSLPAAMMCDGPHGLRIQDSSWHAHVHQSAPATCFPAAAALGCSWDTRLVEEVGRAVCEEARAAGVALILGPGLNIKRNPLCGRNFEYFSEDPYLSGKLAAAFVRGGQSTGVGCCLKHFAANSQEYKRFSSDSVMDERTLREIYLAGFEIAVRESRPRAVMCSYNKLNGVHASDSRFLLMDILRQEWGFDGLAMSDWGGMNDRVAAFQAGCDLNMPGGSRYQQKKARQAVREGVLREADVDACAGRVIRFALDAAEIPKTPCDFTAHHELAVRAAEESAVLLKNNGALPIRGSACLMGDMAHAMRYQGSGSSHVHPTRLIQPSDCLDWPYVQGYLPGGGTTDAYLAEAVSLAKTVETPVIFAGLPDTSESEGVDRPHMCLPPGEERLIEAVAAVNPRTVVVLLCGGAVETSWLEKVNALLYMALPGQAGGQAAVNLLTGKANPSGRLAETWPLQYSDVVSAPYYGQRDAEYREGVFVGYRYYDSAGIPVRFPFGHGLSYTRFAYSGLTVEPDGACVTVENTGEQAGAEVVMLYICPPQGGIARPVRELKGFQKVFLRPGERAELRFPLDERSFALWAGGWKVAQGRYVVEAGGLRTEVERDGCALLPEPAYDWYKTLSGTPSHKDWERLLGRTFASVPPEKGQFTMDHTLADIKEDSFFLRNLYRVMEEVIAWQCGGNRDDPAYKMMLSSATDCALRSMAICAGMRESLFEGLLDIANGQRLRGLGKLIRLW